MSSLSQSCPHCACRVTIKDSGLVGKKIRCPKCKEPFQIQIPSTSPTTPSASLKEPAKKASRLPLILIAGATTALVAASIVVYVVMSRNSDSTSDNTQNNGGQQGKPNGPGDDSPQLQPGGPDDNILPHEPAPKITAQKLAVIPTPNILADFRFSADGKVLNYVSAGFDPRLYRWDVAKRKHLPKQIEVPDSGILSPNGRLIACRVYNQNPGDVMVWDIQSKLPFRALSGHLGEEAAKVAFSRDGKRLVNTTRVKKNGSSKSYAAVWDLEKDKKVGEMRTDGDIKQVSISPDGQLVACTVGEGMGRGVELWPVESKETFKLPFGTDYPVVAGGDFADEGKIFAASAFQSVKLFNVATRQAFAQLDPGPSVPTDNLVRIAISANAKMVAGASEKQPVVIVWHAPSRSQVALLDTSLRAPDLIFSPDGRYLAAASMTDNRIEVWELMAAESK